MHFMILFVIIFVEYAVLTFFSNKRSVIIVFCWVTAIGYASNNNEKERKDENNNMDEEKNKKNFENTAKDNISKDLIEKDLD